MRLKYDLNVGALYIGLTDRPAARTVEIDDNTSVDLDESGGVVGIEVISIAHPWAYDDILRDYSIPAAEVAQLRAYFRATTPGVVPNPTPALNIERNAPVRIPA